MIRFSNKGEHAYYRFLNIVCFAVLISLLFLPGERWAFLEKLFVGVFFAAGVLVTYLMMRYRYAIVEWSEDTLSLSYPSKGQSRLIRISEIQNTEVSDLTKNVKIALKSGELITLPGSLRITHGSLDENLATSADVHGPARELIKLSRAINARVAGFQGDK